MLLNGFYTCATPFLSATFSLLCLNFRNCLNGIVVSAARAHCLGYRFRQALKDEGVHPYSPFEKERQEAKNAEIGPILRWARSISGRVMRSLSMLVVARAW